MVEESKSSKCKGAVSQEDGKDSADLQHVLGARHMPLQAAKSLDCYSCSGCDCIIVLRFSRFDIRTVLLQMVNN